jgi:hypothetical protein
MLSWLLGIEFLRSTCLRTGNVDTAHHAITTTHQVKKDPNGQAGQEELGHSAVSLSDMNRVSQVY